MKFEVPFIVELTNCQVVITIGIFLSLATKQLQSNNESNTQK